MFLWINLAWLNNCRWSVDQKQHLWHIVNYFYYTALANSRNSIQQINEDMRYTFSREFFRENVCGHTLFFFSGSQWSYQQFNTLMSRQLFFFQLSQIRETQFNKSTKKCAIPFLENFFEN